MTAAAWIYLIAAYYREGNFTESVAALEKAVELHDQLDSDSHLVYAMYLDVRFSMHEQHAKAEGILQQSLTATWEISSDNEEVAWALTYLRCAYTNQHKYDMEETACLQSIEMFATLFGEEDSRVAESYSTLSAIYGSEQTIEVERNGLKDD